MRILVTFAVDAEFAPWRKRHGFEPVAMPAPVGTQSPLVYRGTVFGFDADVLLTGIGWDGVKGPGFAVRELLRNKPDICVSSGFAGGLKAELHAADIVAASEILLRGGDLIRSSPELLAAAKEAGAQIVKRQVTETQIASHAAAKAALAEFGDFVDMEGYYILQLASGARVPVISVRAISDTVDEDLPPDLDTLVDRKGHVQALSLVRFLVKRPARIPSLLALGARSKSAAARLADFLDDFLQIAGGDRSEAQAKREWVAAQ